MKGADPSPAYISYLERKIKGEVVSVNRRCLATAIGSLPHTSAEDAVHMTLAKLSHVPVWPQLPGRSFLENMYAQFSEGLPGRVIDMDRQKVYCEDKELHWREIEEFYSAFMEENLDYFAIGRDYASGLHAFVDVLRDADKDYPLIKGQVTGPVSFGLTVTDSQNRPILYDETLADVAVKLLAMKARWMKEKLESTGCAHQVLIFFDEPYLYMVGSALVSVRPEFVVEALNFCANQAGCLTGVHCCGNTDWSLLMKTEIDILNFDAFEYMENLALYPQELTAFLQRGGSLAWGIVPNSDAARDETIPSMVERFNKGVGLLIERGVPEDLLLGGEATGREDGSFKGGLLVMPSCGLSGRVDESTAEYIYEFTSALADELERELLV